MYDSLYSYSYTIGKALTTVSGTLGVQFFINKADTTIATPLININVVNGSRFIPEGSTPSDNTWGTVVQYLNDVIASYSETKAYYKDLYNAHAALDRNAVKLNGEGSQTINKPTEFNGSVALNNEVLVSGLIKFIINGVLIGGFDMPDGIFDFPTINASSNITAPKASEYITVGGVKFKPDEVYPTIIVPSNIGDINDTEITGTDIMAYGVSAEYLGVSSDAAVGGDIMVNGNLDLDGNVSIGGNLIVKGSTITESYESVLVKDNIIITNAGENGTSTGGVVIRTSDFTGHTAEAYGILYSRRHDSVVIGMGTLTEFNTNDDDGNKVTTYEFEFADGASHPVALRENFDDSKDGFIPVWDKDKNAFVPSHGDNKVDGNLKVMGAIQGVGDTSLNVLNKYVKLNRGASNDSAIVYDDAQGGMSGLVMRDGELYAVSGAVMEPNDYGDEWLVGTSSKIVTEQMLNAELGNLYNLIDRLNNGGNI